MEYAPVCGIDGNTYGNTCAAGCAQTEVAYTGECQFGVPGVCQRGYSGPVCGVDGTTYDDICDMEDAGVERAYDGLCVENPNPLNIVDVPSFCTSWYDGCNECGVENSQLTLCTERACIHQDRAKCTAFEFQHLNSFHLSIVESFVYDWRDRASASAIQQAIAKVEQKIDDINYTLSVSSFVG